MFAFRHSFFRRPGLDPPRFTELPAEPSAVGARAHGGARACGASGCQTAERKIERGNGWFMERIHPGSASSSHTPLLSSSAGGGWKGWEKGCDAVLVLHAGLQDNADPNVTIRHIP